MNPLDPSPAEKSAAIAEIESRLNANPSIARQLDGNGTGTRRQKIEATLNFIRARKDEIAATKASLSAKLISARAKLAALGTVKATNASLKAKLATARTPRPALAPAPAKPQLTGLALTAASFAASAKPAEPRPNRPSARPLTGLAKVTAAFQKSSAASK